MKLVVSPDAAIDLGRLHGFLAAENPAAAARAAATIRDAIDSLADFPGRGRPSGIPNTHDLIVPFGRSAYLIRYALLADQETVVIVRVWHGREQR